MAALAILAFILAVSGPAPATVAQAPADTAPNPQRAFSLIRAKFRSHRPPPPFESYTLTRSQLAADGSVDTVNSYAKHVWVRTSDGAALARSFTSDGTRGDLTFDRPAFNEARDPGPPTADMFADDESDYHADSLETTGGQLHLRVSPVRDPDRHRLRELYADAATYELRGLVAADKLYVYRGPTYPVTFTITMGAVQGMPVVTRLHGVVGGGYNDDGKEVDYAFTDIAFPPSLPDWYFDPKTYGAHRADAPG
jgi:hypothetical protein